MSPLLRIPELPPLDLSRKLQDDQEEADHLFSSVVISPCQVFVSNDPDTNEDEINRNPCNITSFECFESTGSDYGASQGGQPSSVTVKFDYEMWYSPPQQFNLTVLQLESSMLQHLAKVFGLLECPTITPKRSYGSNRRLQVFSQEIADLFVGVDSTPVDVPDVNNPECIVPVQTSEMVDAICQPMTGYFSASVDADLEADSTAEASVRSGLLRLLRVGMKENLYANGNVRKVSFIGDRTNYVPTVQTSTDSNTSSLGMSSVALTFTILAAIIAFLIAGFLFRKTMKKKKQQEAKGVRLEEDFHPDVDDSSFDKSFTGEDYTGDIERNDKQCSLAATDELSLVSQDAISPVLTPMSDDAGAEEASFEAPTEPPSEAPTPPQSEAPSKAPSELMSESPATACARPAVLPANHHQTAAAELDLFLSTAATPTADTLTEISPTIRATTPKKKRKKRKRKKSAAPDSPDSLDESLKTLDSIAEEPSNTPPEFEDSDSDSVSVRSLT